MLVRFIFVLVLWGLFIYVSLTLFKRTNMYKKALQQSSEEDEGGGR